MLRRNHPKFDLVIISQIYVRAIHRMNVRTEMHVRISFRWEIYESQIIPDVTLSTFLSQRQFL